jgi:hypothetical protein
MVCTSSPIGLWSRRDGSPRPVGRRSGDLPDAGRLQPHVALSEPPPSSLPPPPLFALPRRPHVPAVVDSLQRLPSPRSKHWPLAAGLSGPLTLTRRNGRRPPAGRALKSCRESSHVCRQSGMAEGEGASAVGGSSPRVFLPPTRPSARATPARISAVPTRTFQVSGSPRMRMPSTTATMGSR